MKFSKYFFAFPLLFLIASSQLSIFSMERKMLARDALLIPSLAKEEAVAKLLDEVTDKEVSLDATLEGLIQVHKLLIANLKSSEHDSKPSLRIFSFLIAAYEESVKKEIEITSPAESEKHETIRNVFLRIVVGDFAPAGALAKGIEVFEFLKKNLGEESFVCKQIVFNMRFFIRKMLIGSI
jgi:hypothetical protein